MGKSCRELRVRISKAGTGACSLVVFIQLPDLANKNTADWKDLNFRYTTNHVEV